MKLMVTLNVQNFVAQYNSYAVMNDAEAITNETVYNLLEKVFNTDVNRELKCTYVLFTAEELEKFAGLFINAVWKEIALGNSTNISFFQWQNRGVTK